MTPRNEAADTLRDHSPTLYPASNHGSQLVCSCGHIDHMAGWWAHIKVSVLEPMLIAQRQRVVERLTADRLAAILEDEFDFDDMVMSASPEKSAERILPRILDALADGQGELPPEHVHDWTAGTQVTPSGLPNSTCIAPGHQEEPPDWQIENVRQFLESRAPEHGDPSLDVERSALIDIMGMTVDHLDDRRFRIIHKVAQRAVDHRWEEPRPPPTPPLRGVWEVSSKVELSPYVAERAIELLKDAAAEGKQIVVVEGIEFRWRPIEITGQGEPPLDVLLHALRQIWIMAGSAADDKDPSPDITLGIIEEMAREALAGSGEPSNG